MTKNFTFIALIGFYGSVSFAQQAVQQAVLQDFSVLGATGQTVILRSATGKTIQTQSCGAVSELTLTHKASEPAMVGQVLQAMNAGKVLVLVDGQCVGGKAIATSASPAISAAQAAPVMSQADRCKLPLAKERMAGC